MIKKLKQVRRRKKKQWIAAIQSNKVLNSNTQLQNVFYIGNIQLQNYFLTIFETMHILFSPNTPHNAKMNAFIFFQNQRMLQSTRLGFRLACSLENLK